MKANKLFLVLVLGLILPVVLVTDVAAAPDYYECNVITVGTNELGWVIVNLTDVDGAFDSKSFMVKDDATKREILAVALTAASKGFKVNARVDPLAGGFGPPPITALDLIISTN